MTWLLKCSNNPRERSQNHLMLSIAGPCHPRRSSKTQERHEQHVGHMSRPYRSALSRGSFSNCLERLNPISFTLWSPISPRWWRALSGRPFDINTLHPNGFYKASIRSLSDEWLVDRYQMNSFLPKTKKRKKKTGLIQWIIVWNFQKPARMNQKKQWFYKKVNQLQRDELFGECYESECHLYKTKKPKKNIAINWFNLSLSCLDDQSQRAKTKIWDGLISPRKNPLSIRS